MPSPSTLMTATTRLVAPNPTSGVAASEANQSSRPSKITIALLAVIGSLVVIVFAGFFIFSQVRNYRARRSRKPTFSFNFSMGRGIQISPSRTNPRESNATFFTEPRRVESAYLSPPLRPQQTRETAPVKDEVPRFRFSSHPYKAAASISSMTTDPANRTQSDMRSLALALPVSSHAGTHGSCSSRLTFVGHTARGSHSSSGHERSDSAGKSDEATDRPSLKISTTPPLQNLVSNQKLSLPERKYSKSFLIFDDGDSPTSSSFVVVKPQFPLPPTPEHVGTSIPGGGQAPTSAKMMVATMSYKPRLYDELSLNVGDVVKLVHEYDDGWCVVEQVGTTKSGAVPRVCLHEKATT